MNCTMPINAQFDKYYQKHQKCLKLNGLQPKTIDAYCRAIRRIGNYFDCRIDNSGSCQHTHHLAITHLTSKTQNNASQAINTLVSKEPDATDFSIPAAEDSANFCS